MDLAQQILSKLVNQPILKVVTGDDDMIHERLERFIHNKPALGSLRLFITEEASQPLSVHKCIPAAIKAVNAVPDKSMELDRFLPFVGKIIDEHLPPMALQFVIDSNDSLADNRVLHPATSQAQ